ncbi:hypothetical protein FGM00_11900 [Aggregatimonas sangjinii]|uniref:TonB-dependent receptor plug domain-containing protein n=1 Tax=Aggregatimonas sangjinii TaxID=2583587 RepID=A0A5B7SQ96_9FLAO|nr:hypothetical protein [Aggregatimonas sangjinii]QCX00776.1 hypothetical protein FGM00_11900 [Aggregatimonas sangjinii]
MRKIIIALAFCFVSIVPMVAQDQLKMEIKEEKKPAVYIDGIQYDHAIFDLLDQSKIATVNVIKNEKAAQEYDAPNGVILITTKKASKKAASVEGNDQSIITGEEDPMVIIDGKISTKAVLSSMSPDTIATINILKGQAAIDQYNAPNGVILVHTKE